MAVTINAKGTSISTFTVGKNGLTLAQAGEITPPSGNDLVINLDTNNNLVVDAGISGPSLITTTDSKDLHINPAVGGGQYLLLNAVRWPVTDGTNGQVLQTNGSGVLSFATLSGTGTVTSASVVTANGLAGTVATATTTPAITLSTTVTGVVKGDGTTLSAAGPSDITTALGYTPAPTASPALTGNPTAPTPALSDNDTSIANTAYVQNEFANGFGSGGFAFKNKIINGNFDIWQRGTSQTAAGYGSADRWKTEYAGTTITLSRQAFSPGQTAVPNNPNFFSRCVVSSVAGAGNLGIFEQLIENVGTLSGQTATLSFWAKADASRNISVEFLQVFGSGGSASINSIGVTKVALTTAWTKFTVSVSVPSISGKTIGTSSFLQFNFWLDAGTDFNSRTNSLGQQSGTFDIAQIQLEEGSVATPFEQRPPGLELTLCQRYYEFATTPTIWSGMTTNGAVYYNINRFAVVKRVAPTIVMTHVAVNSFPAVAPAATAVQPDQFYCQATANATGTGAYYQYSYTASAEF